MLDYSSDLVSKESACNAGDLGLISGLGRSLETEMVTHPSVLTWEIPWTEEPGGLKSMGSQEPDRLSDKSMSLDLVTNLHPHL